MKKFHSLVLGGVFCGLLTLSACGASITSYEERLGSEKKVVAERYLPTSLDLLFSLDTRDTTSLTYVLNTLHRYFPEYIQSGDTLETLAERYSPLLQDELALPDDLYADLRAITPLVNRMVVAVDLFMTVNGEEKTQEYDVYMSFMVQDMARMQVLYEKFIALPEVEERVYNGTKYLATEGLGEQNVYGILQDDVMFVTLSERAMHRLLDVRANKEPSFLSQQFVRDVENHLEKPVLLSGYFNYDGYLSLGLFEPETEEERKMMERMYAVMPYPGLNWGQIFVSERGIEFSGLSEYDDLENQKRLGMSFGEIVSSGPTLGTKITEGSVLYMQEMQGMVRIVAPLFRAIFDMPGEEGEQARFGLTYLTNMLQYHTGLSWQDEILPFLDLPTLSALVDEGEILPRMVQLTDVQSNPELGERVVVQTLLSMDKLISFLDLQFAETEFPLPSSLYTKESIPGGARLRYKLAPYYQEYLGEFAQYFSGSALAMLRSLEVTMEVTNNDTTVLISLGVSSSLPQLGKDDVFLDFSGSFLRPNRLSLSYLGVTAAAAYVGRLYDAIDDFGIKEISYASLSEEERAIQEEQFQEGSTILSRVLEEMRRFTSLQSVTVVENDRLVLTYMLIPFAK